MARRWATLGELQTLSRRRILEAIDWLDAIEDAEKPEPRAPKAGKT